MAESILASVPVGTGNPYEDGAALHLRPDYGVLLLGDSDRRDFLHRLTTNEINNLRAGSSTVTILTNPTARVLFAFTAVVREDDMLVLPGAGQDDALARYLRGQIFFMDAVKVADQSEAWARMRLVGTRATDALAVLGIELADADDGAWAEQSGIIAVKQDRYDVPGYELICPQDQSGDVIAQLNGAGVAILEDVDYEQRRVLLGRPAAGAELNDAFNPLESGMAWACSDSKGCYTGQEIIARQITYDKVTRTLVGIRSEHDMTPGADIQVDGRNAGSITSVTADPASDDHLALAILKRPSNEPGIVVTIDGHTAVVTSLPFVGG